MSRWMGHPPGTLGKRAPVLVVGGGLAGMTTALYLAEWGAEVTLVERAPHVGGAFLHLDHTFTTDSCGLCLALPRQPSLCPTIATEDHPRITPMTHSTLTGLRGELGRFMATLRHAPRYVDPERCNSCGRCAEACTVMRSQVHRIAQPSWGRFLQEDPLRRKAIYPPVPRAVPTAYAIDSDVCTRCGACVQVCPHGAIDLGATGREDAMRVEAVVLAPGSATFDAARAVEYGYGRCANVVTSLELECMLNRSGPTRGRILRPSDGRVAQRMASVHCVGSRSDALERPYCSSFC
ncbi:MAG: CoB--CoM heterodisulfide reductase iron-sulfur subunit A family protein, partial [Anaerolineae bacterium]|nr:CoB--CoM heterodisulfide reductase iron-sulfur subunit A family protein [Anaerolineae bacterium]